MLLTRKEAASRLGISLRTLDRRITSGALPCIRDHARAKVLIDEKSIEKYINDHQVHITSRRRSLKCLNSKKAVS